MKHYTSISQSRKLLKLGLNPETSDMIHICSIIHGKENGFLDVVPKESILYAMHTTIEEKEKSIPCWSLGALLEVMPIIKKGIDEYLPYFIKGSEIWKGKIQSFWYCSYALLDDSNTELITFRNSTAVEAAYNMVVWLLENNYIKKEGNT